jgi:small subunit ribosomal protein S5
MKAYTKPLVIPGKIDISELALTEKLVSVDRVAKVVKGGKRMSFRALVVIGDGAGCVGAGIGKAAEVPEAIRKAGVEARKGIIRVPLKGTTIPHEVLAKFGAAQVLLRPASEGTGIIAAGGCRAVVESAGIKDVLTKSLGASSAINVVRATLLALMNVRVPEEVVRRRKAGVVAGGGQERE